VNRKERRKKGKGNSHGPGPSRTAREAPTVTPPVSPAHGLAQRYACSLWCDGEEREWDVSAAPTVIDTTYWHQVSFSSTNYYMCV
jgi:hypothetical protein